MEAKVVFSKGIVSLDIPIDFIRSYEPLSWTEVLWGCRNGYVGHHALVELACLQIAQDDRPVQALIELSWLTPTHHFDIEGFAEALAKREPSTDVRTIRGKWLHLILAWLIRTWKDIPNPPGVLECILAQFEYPDEFSELNRVCAGMSGTAGDQPRRKTDAALLELLKEHFLRLGIALPVKH